MSISSLLVKYYNWYKRFVIVFFTLFVVFLIYVFFTDYKTNNDKYSDFMINKYLLSNNKIKKEKQDLVSNNLVDLKTIASLNELDKESQQKSLELLLNKNNSEVLHHTCEFLYAYLMVSNNKHSDMLYDIFSKLDDKHIFHLDMYFLKAVYLVQKDNLEEANRLFNYILLIQHNKKHIFADIDTNLIDAFRFYIKQH